MCKRLDVQVCKCADLQMMFEYEDIKWGVISTNYLK